MGAAKYILVEQDYGIAVRVRLPKRPMRLMANPSPTMTHACRCPEMPERQLNELVLSDESWARIAPHIIGDGNGRGAPGKDNRMFVEGVLWVARTGAAWRDLPEIFGGWNTVFRRFSRWSHKGIWDRIFATAIDDPDFKYRIDNGAIIYVGGRAIGAKMKALRIAQGTRRRTRGERDEGQYGARGEIQS
jgi:putative transposase